MNTLEKYKLLHKLGHIEHKEMNSILGYEDTTTFWAYRNNKRNVKLPTIKYKVFKKVVANLYKKIMEK